MSARRKSKQPPEVVEYDAELYRHLETTRGFIVLHAGFDRPGPKTIPVDFWDYHFGVLVATGSATTIHTDIFDEAMEEGDLSAFARAAADVRKIRETGLNDREMRMVSVIAAKLELEEKNGFLPTQAAVKKRARDLYQHRWGRDAPPLTDSSGWRKAIADAELGYLPTRNVKNQG